MGPDSRSGPSNRRRVRLCLLAVDVQNTCCIPDFELFVAGRSGTGAVDDNHDLTVWPYHATLGGIGHALASAVEGHLLPRHRSTQPTRLPGQGRQPAHRALLGPEVTERPDGDHLGRKNTELIDKLLTFDAVGVEGQAKSHCVAWTIDDLLQDDEVRQRLAPRTYLLEDCTSPVVVPGAVDYTDEADARLRAFTPRPACTSFDRPTRSQDGRAWRE